MQKLLPFLIFCICFNSFAQQEFEDLSLEYYLPQDVSYNEEIPKPQDVIGYIPGEWHVTHDLLLNYMRELARVSPRISIENRGETYEGRPLILLTITSKENHENLEEIRKNHLALTQENASSLNVEEMPIVVNQGFSIHGNEASGSNAALLAAYYLAAAEGEEIKELLEIVHHEIDTYQPERLIFLDLHKFE